MLGCKVALFLELVMAVVLGTAAAKFGLCQEKYRQGVAGFMAWDVAGNV
jgi:hypothetical protein